MSSFTTTSIATAIRQYDSHNTIIIYFIDYRASRLPLDTDSMGYWTCKLINLLDSIMLV